MRREDIVPAILADVVIVMGDTPENTGVAAKCRAYAAESTSWDAHVLDLATLTEIPPRNET